MGRIIDADKFFMKAYNAAYPVIHGNNDRENGLTMYGIAQLLDEQPTIDAVPVRHGHWIKIGSQNSIRNMKCSICGEEVFGDADTEKYCFNCGSKMDEKVTE